MMIMAIMHIKTMVMLVRAIMSVISMVNIALMSATMFRDDYHNGEDPNDVDRTMIRI